MLRRKHKDEGELFDEWQNIMLSNIGITPNTDKKAVKEALRRIILSSSRLYQNLERMENGMKPIEWR